MSSFTFDAACVITEHPERECHLVGFADREYETECYLLLQRAFDFSEQDVELGMDTYHVEWCGQETSGYGGISRLTLKPGSVDVSFETGITEEFDGMDQLSIHFQLSAGKHAALEKALEHIFAGSKCLAIAEANPSVTGVFRQATGESGT